jgi:hypothetical protein
MAIPLDWLHLYHTRTPRGLWSRSKDYRKCIGWRILNDSCFLRYRSRLRLFAVARRQSATSKRWADWLPDQARHGPECDLLSLNVVINLPIAYLLRTVREKLDDSWRSVSKSVIMEITISVSWSMILSNTLFRAIYPDVDGFCRSTRLLDEHCSLQESKHTGNMVTASDTTPWQCWQSM